MKGPWTKDPDREAMLKARLIRARHKMLTAGIKPLVKSESDRVDVGLRPAWQKLNDMGTHEAPAQVVPMRKRK